MYGVKAEMNINESFRILHTTGIFSVWTLAGRGTFMASLYFFEYVFEYIVWKIATLAQDNKKVYKQIWCSGVTLNSDLKYYKFNFYGWNCLTLLFSSSTKQTARLSLGFWTTEIFARHRKKDGLRFFFFHVTRGFSSVNSIVCNQYSHYIYIYIYIEIR